jgi:predicted RNase H-like HicB family nuclease
MRKILRYNVIFRPEPEGGFTVLVPSLPGCITYGRNLKEAKKMAIDAIKGYIASLKKTQRTNSQR